MVVCSGGHLCGRVVRCGAALPLLLLLLSIFLPLGSASAPSVPSLPGPAAARSWLNPQRGHLRGAHMRPGGLPCECSRGARSPTHQAQTASPTTHSSWAAACLSGPPVLWCCVVRCVVRRARCAAWPCLLPPLLFWVARTPKMVAFSLFFLLFFCGLQR